MKNTDLQNRICQRVEPSNDFTNKPPKLRLQAPKNTKKGPGILLRINYKHFNLSY